MEAMWLACATTGRAHGNLSQVHDHGADLGRLDSTLPSRLRSYITSSELRFAYLWSVSPLPMKAQGTDPGA